MNVINVIKDINKDLLYKHILRLEGTKNPIETPDKLDEAADYISNKFKEYGLQVAEHHFEIEGLDRIFRNIEGFIGNEDYSDILISSHYDTVINSPGANDNGTGIAVMLEAARIIAKEHKNKNIRFICFSLEESNPAIELKRLKSAQKYQLLDKNYRPVSLRAADLIKNHRKIYRNLMDKGSILPEALQEALNTLKSNLKPNEFNFFRELINIYNIVDSFSTMGKTGLMGSSAWVATKFKSINKINCLINLDSVGYISNQKNSQQMPYGLKFKSFPNYKIKEKDSIGDFLVVIGDNNSKNLAYVFCNQCRLPSIDLSYVNIQPALSFDQIAKDLNMLLWADHAPFWKNNVPALFLTDTGDLRTPYEHTPADTIDKLNFDFLEKVTKATIATITNIIAK